MRFRPFRVGVGAFVTLGGLEMLALAAWLGRWLALFRRWQPGGLTMTVGGILLIAGISALPYSFIGSHITVLMSAIVGIDCGLVILIKGKARWL